MRKELVRTSKFLSKILRHTPESVGLELDAFGWADVGELLEKLAIAGHQTTRPTLDEVVATDEKKRFAYSADGSKIRANQGHSIEVQLELTPEEPPARLFHGTATRNLPSIREHGLCRQNRQYVHLSSDADTARRVGQRHGRPVVLIVASGEMQDSGAIFFLSANGVWLTQSVPPNFITFPEEAKTTRGAT